jgi:hypothetical protein
MEIMEETILNRFDAYSEAYNNLNEFYKDPVKKKLVNYLLTFFLNERPYYILFSKSPLRDSLSGSKLNTVFDNRNPVPKRGELRDLTESFRESSDEDKKKIRKRVQEILQEMNIESKRHRLAVSVDGSRKILGVEEHTALLDWAIDNIKNKTVNGILRFSTWGDRHSEDNKHLDEYNKDNNRDLINEDIIRVLRKRMGIIKEGEEENEEERGE